VAPEIIKICGITRVEDGLMAAREGATAIGLNFYPGSLRYVDFGRAAVIAAATPHGVLRVGIFVDETADRIAETARAVGLDVVQLHGHESAYDCEVLEPLRVWKAFRVGDGFEFRQLADFRCEAFLLDTAGGDGALGGSGRTFPWEMARAASRYGKIIIAGGLDGTNVAEAIRMVSPWGVDSSSRLERSPGVKDAVKVRDFVRAARSQEAPVSHV
jgi:phosphoribosylanthranilate isomerase